VFVAGTKGDITPTTAATTAPTIQLFFDFTDKPLAFANPTTVTPTLSHQHGRLIARR
jgi:hypothetical protein